MESRAGSFGSRLAPSLGGDCVIKKQLIDDLLDSSRKPLSKFSELAMIEKLNIDLINRGG